jgi:putative glutamine amidotransferase
MELEKPIFGICRGHQLINVALGGSLIQHLPTAKDHEHIRLGLDRVHPCTADPDSWIAGIYGTRFAVNSSHHQGVDRPGKGLRTVLCAPDGVIEAMQHETLPVWSVQFHPERMCYAHRREDTVDGSLLFRFFLEKCEKPDQ